MLPFEVQAMILRYAVDNILNDLRRTDTDVPYYNRLRQWLCLRLTSKTFDSVLSQLRFNGRPINELLRRKQLEKLDFVVEALLLTADMPPTCSRLSIPKLKRLCGKFWHNPELSAPAVRNIALLLQSPQSLNFAVKLEPWITRHRERSTSESTSHDKVLFFDRGDWIVDAGDLQIKRVSRWQSTARTRIGMYLSHETQMPLTPVHVRLEHDRRWYMEFTTAGREVLRCMVNYNTKMVWDHSAKRLYDFEGRQYHLDGAETEELDAGETDE